MLWSTGVSVRGPDHASKDEANQDALGLWGWKNGRIAVLSDGMGSRPLSQIGSRLACLVTRRAVRARTNLDDIKSLVAQVYRLWLQMLPIPPSQAACTLLFAISLPDGDTVLAQLGDGLIAYRTGGKFHILTTERGGFGNQTEALGISKSWSDWRAVRMRFSQPGDGVLMTSDGVSDDLVPERIEDFFRMVHRECRKRTHRQAKRWLRNQFEAWPTPGHSDDKTIGMIFFGPK